MAGWGHSGINPKLQISSVFPYQWPWMSQTSHRFASSFCQLHPSALVLSCQSWDKENHRDYTKAETWHHRCAAENIWDNQVMVANWILLQSKSVQLYGCLPRDCALCYCRGSWVALTSHGPCVFFLQWNLPATPLAGTAFHPGLPNTLNMGKKMLAKYFTCQTTKSCLSCCTAILSSCSGSLFNITNLKLNFYLLLTVFLIWDTWKA